jgi:hypothetical protein
MIKIAYLSVSGKLRSNRRATSKIVEIRTYDITDIIPKVMVMMLPRYGLYYFDRL